MIIVEPFQCRNPSKPSEVSPNVFLFLLCLRHCPVGRERVLLGQLDPAGLAHVEVASPVAVDPGVLDMPRGDGAEVACYRAPVLCRDQLVPQWTLPLADGHSHALGAVIGLACIALTAVVVVGAVSALFPNEWETQGMVLGASIGRPPHELRPLLLGKGKAGPAVQVKLSLGGEFCLAV